MVVPAKCCFLEARMMARVLSRPRISLLVAVSFDFNLVERRETNEGGDTVRG